MRRGILKPKIATFAYTLLAALILSALIGVNSAEAKDGIVLCTIDDLSGDFSIMATPKTVMTSAARKRAGSPTKRLKRLSIIDDQTDEIFPTRTIPGGLVLPGFIFEPKEPVAPPRRVRRASGLYRRESHVCDASRNPPFLP